MKSKLEILIAGCGQDNIIGTSARFKDQTSSLSTSFYQVYLCKRKTDELGIENKIHAG